MERAYLDHPSMANLSPLEPFVSGYVFCGLNLRPLESLGDSGRRLGRVSLKSYLTLFFVVFPNYCQNKRHPRYVWAGGHVYDVSIFFSETYLIS